MKIESSVIITLKAEERAYTCCWEKWKMTNPPVEEDMVEMSLM